jgi:predicted DNA-binding protein with PD1-like motif
VNDYRVKRTILGQLPFGSDLYEELTAIVRREGIRLGRIQALGATTHARVAYYDQNTKVYNPIEFPGGMEILNVHGNVSVRDGEPFVHAHILLGDPAGKIFGGHLLPGTKLFACEVFIDELEGPPLERRQEGRTGLHLWNTGYLS